jgi:LacI family transcriptional regulator
MGSLDEATRADVQLICERMEAGERDAVVAERLVKDGIDGVVLTPPLCESAPVVAVFAAAGVPVVLLGTERCGPGRHAVAIDDRRAAGEMTRHLLALGHRRIGFVTGDPALSASARRLDGYRDALTAAGLAADADLVAPGLFTYRSGLDAADRLLSLSEPPSAIFASNDDMAAAAVATAHRHGLDVPGDLTVTGFDDTALATTVWPELTTVRQPIADMTRRAVDMLARIIRGGAEPGLDAPVAFVDFELVRRQSDAPPRLLRRARARHATDIAD